VQRNTFAAGVTALALVAVVVGLGGSEADTRIVADGSDAAPRGAVTGVVNFAGTAPAMPAIDMSDDAVCVEAHSSPVLERAVEVNGNGTLKGVFIYVKEGLDEAAQYPQPTDSVWVDQQGCRYTPNVVGVRVRQTLAIRNSDPATHNVHATATANRGFNISQPVQGMVSTRSFRTPEAMVEVTCDVHGWMIAHIGVMSHPFFATTGDDGSFTIPDLPEGTYTLEAWHGQYGTQTAEVTVGADGATTEFTFGS